MDSKEDYYEILQVSRAAEPEVIEAAYRRLSRKYHPDVDKSFDALKRMQLINRAYETLSDPRKRADYDNKYQRTSESKKDYQENTHKHSETKNNTTTRKGDKRILWGITISAIILLFLYLQNSNKEVSTRGTVTPTLESIYTNSKSPQPISQLAPKTQQEVSGKLDYQAAKAAGYSDKEIKDFLKSNPNIRLYNNPENNDPMQIIRNNRTGQTIQVPQSQLGRYGITLPQQQDTYALEVQKVMAEGYTPYGMQDNDSFLLHVLIGMRTGTADGYDKRAFFFYQGKYLGTDTKNISAMISSPWRDDKTIALEYTLYKKADPLCCPTGGSKIVRFQWDGTKLNALDPIPTDDWDTDFSRR